DYYCMIWHNNAVLF
nr:immunoglobulin light chain junction region [Macaca mulatta]MOW04355.1 immunoglobulin light chain junction region [Macaca mulatta]MOW04364.1 immunoglobulin light chain junction region [Macaca mulatta]MOW04467.1 immunoglobulin light chain junction region [Macaca mulatta]MOW04599.1 immunoglobulin light chain junction region [Macaca mulatta]